MTEHLSLGAAAKLVGVHKTTLRRHLEALEDHPELVKLTTGWHVPVSALIAAGYEVDTPVSDGVAPGGDTNR